MIPPWRLDEVERAHATLRRGARFLAVGLGAPGSASAGPFPSKVIGNALGEMDRFLHLLIEAVGAASGIVIDTRQRNTPNKLSALRAGTDEGEPERPRLSALGRSRACLFHNGGLVAQPDQRGGAWMTAGWPEATDHDAPLRRFAIGERLDPTAGDLADVAAFYHRLGGELVAGMAAASLRA